MPSLVVSEQPHVTLSKSVFVNAKPVESCLENVSDLLSFIYLLFTNIVYDTRSGRPKHVFGRDAFTQTAFFLELRRNTGFL